MELPNYRLPAPKNVIRLLWEKAKDFLQRAFSVILIATIVVWFLQSFDLHLNFTEESHTSILAQLAGLLAPVLAPAGLGDWRICTALITGFMAKESVVSTLEILFGSDVAGAVAAIRREMGAKWAAGVVLWQCLLAWICAVLTRLVLAGVLS